MANVTKHKKVSAKSDGGDATLIRPGNWNEEHVFGGGADTDLLTRDSGQSDGVAWVARSAVGGSSKPAFLLSPEGATFPTANFPQLLKNSGTNWTDYTLDYDDGTVGSEAAFWRVAIPAGATFTGAEMELYYRVASAVVNAVVFQATSITRADAEAFDTAGVADAFTASTVPGTAGQVRRITKTLTVTGWAAAEVLLVKIARLPADGGDTLVGDCKFIEAVIRLT